MLLQETGSELSGTNHINIRTSISTNHTVYYPINIPAVSVPKDIIDAINARSITVLFRTSLLR